jgi:outer membrane protein assembly factor BamB
MMNRRVTGSLIALLAVCLSGAVLEPNRVAASTGTGDQAVAYQSNITHSGGISGDILAPPLVKQWSRTDLGGTVSYPLIAGGKVFVTVQGPYGSSSSPPKWIYALDEATGATVWSHSIGGTYGFVNAAYDSGTVYVLNFDGLLQTFNAGTGAAGWSVQLTGQSSFTSPPTADNGTVYVVGSGLGGTLYTINETNGAPIWTAALNAGDHSSPALSSGSVFVSVSCDVYAFDRGSLPGTNPLLWHKNYGCTGGGGKTPVLNGNSLYVRNEGVAGTNDILDVSTGNSTGGFNARPAPAFSGTTGFFLNSGTLQAVNPNGVVLWSFAGDGGLDTAPIVVNNDVYVGSSSGTLYAVDVNSGQSVWSDSVGTAIQAPDEQNAATLTGLGAGEGRLIVPAGSTVTAYTPVSADTTPPVITSSVSGTQGPNGWYVGPVTVTWTVTDPESGISSSSGCGSSTVSADTAGTTFTCTATNGAGLTSSSSVSVKLDSTAPTLSCSSPPTGWSASDATIACKAGDVTSGLANGNDVSFGLSTIVPAGTETNAASTPSHAVCDVAGNCVTTGPYTGLKVDKKAPSITLNVPGGGTYTLNANVAASFGCTDGGSGVATCAGLVPSGGAIDTSSVGGKTFTVNATDAVGNAAAPQVAAYTVTYGICQSSVPTIKSGHIGSVSVQLCNAGLANMSSTSIALTASGIYTASGTLVQPLNNTFAYTSSLNNAGSGYTEKVSASGLATGTYSIAFKATGDGVTHQAAFAVK